MPLSRRLSIFVGITAAVLVLDQWTKHLANQYLQGKPPRFYLGDTVRVLYALNRGAFLSLGDGFPDWLRFWLFTVAVGGLLVFLTVYALRSPDLDTPSLVAYCAFISGGIANWIDRVRFDGVVVDFLNIGIGPVRTGVFNVADVAVMVGIGILLIYGRRRVEPAPTPPGPAA